MKKALNTPVADGITRREGLLTLLGSALALAGCGGGGGGGVAGVSSGGTGSFAAGPITGFGSIIVNGVHFDDLTASSILDVDDDNNDMRNKLKLGMMVRVKGKPKKDNNHADAEDIEVRSELLGPIDSIDTTAKTFVVLGQTVLVTATTIFEEGLSGLSALVVGDIVEVHGFVDPVANKITATRIERKDPAKVKAFKLQGTLSADADTTAQTFKIGTLTISFAPPVDMPANLALVKGLLVRVRLATTPTTGTRKALKIRAVEVEAEVEDRDEAEVEGTITSIDPANNKLFKVNGLQVDATGVSALPTLKVGDRVEVEGKMVKGVLVANKVELEDENDPEKFEVHGTVGSLNTTAKTFVLSVSGVTVTVDYSATTDFRPAGKTAADLANGVKVEVRGMASTDGTKVKASRISFE